jgi:hypothetical protein
MSEEISRKILSANKAVEGLFEWLFHFMERCDDIRSSLGGEFNFKSSVKEFLTYLSESGDPSLKLSWSDVSSSENRVIQDEIDESAKGFLEEDSSNRTWASTCDVHSCCWISLAPAFSLAFKDALQEIDEACYKKKEEKKPSYGQTATRNMNWGKKNGGKRGRPAKKKDPNAQQFKKPVGRPRLPKFNDEWERIQKRKKHAAYMRKWRKSRGL